MANGKKKIADSGQSSDWPFGKKNYILLAASLLIIIVGYICLGYGDDPNNSISMTLAPILLVAGYVLVPFAIMARDKDDEELSGESESTEA